MSLWITVTSTTRDAKAAADNVRSRSKYELVSYGGECPGISVILQHEAHSFNGVDHMVKYPLPFSLLLAQREVQSLDQGRHDVARYPNQVRYGGNEVFPDL